MTLELLFKSGFVLYSIVHILINAMIVPSVMVSSESLDAAKVHNTAFSMSLVSSFLFTFLLLAPTIYYYFITDTSDVTVSIYKMLAYVGGALVVNAPSVTSYYLYTHDLVQ